MRPSSAIFLLLLICACVAAPPREPVPESGPPVEQQQEVFVYRACAAAAPGELMAQPRQVSADLDPVAGAIGALLRGVTAEERARGCSSYFSAQTESVLRSVHYSADDTIVVDFRDFSAAIPDVPGAKSFLPPGVMAELTWTIFQQFPAIEAVHFSFEGSERDFWTWLTGEPAEPQTFTRRMWEQV
jgi:hypothetical protein